MDWRHHRNRFVFYKHGWRRSSQHRSDAQSGYQFHRTWRTYANGRRYGVLHRLLRNYGGELFYRNARKLRLRYRRKWGVGKVYELPKRWGSVVLPIMCLSLTLCLKGTLRSLRHLFARFHRVGEKCLVVVG